MQCSYDIMESQCIYTFNVRVSLTLLYTVLSPLRSPFRSLFYSLYVVAFHASVLTVGSVVSSSADDDDAPAAAAAASNCLIAIVDVPGFGDATGRLIMNGDEFRPPPCSQSESTLSTCEGRSGDGEASGGDADGDAAGDGEVTVNNGNCGVFNAGGEAGNNENSSTTPGGECGNSKLSLFPLAAKFVPLATLGIGVLTPSSASLQSPIASDISTAVAVISGDAIAV